MRRFIFSERALRDYQALPAAFQKKVDKQLALLLRDFRHPSLRAKKYDESRDIWQGRITRSYRFYFQIDDGTLYILAVVRHPK